MSKELLCAIMLIIFFGVMVYVGFYSRKHAKDVNGFVLGGRGVRPAGAQPKDCAIVKAAFRAAELLGIEPEYRYESSTDANIPISMGIPAITVGRGGEEDGADASWSREKRTCDRWNPGRCSAVRIFGSSSKSVFRRSHHSWNDDRCFSVYIR